MYPSNNIEYRRQEDNTSGVKYYPREGEPIEPPSLPDNWLK